MAAPPRHHPLSVTQQRAASSENCVGFFFGRRSERLSEREGGKGGIKAGVEGRRRRTKCLPEVRTGAGGVGWVGGGEREDEEGAGQLDFPSPYMPGSRRATLVRRQLRLPNATLPP